MDPIRSFPTPPAPQPTTNARAAFFQAAMGQTPAAAPTPAAPASVTAAPPEPMRPGRLLDIRV